MQVFELNSESVKAAIEKENFAALEICNDDILVIYFQDAIDYVELTKRLKEDGLQKRPTSLKTIWIAARGSAKQVRRVDDVNGLQVAVSFFQVHKLVECQSPAQSFWMNKKTTNK